MTDRTPKRPGFTLIELIIVIGVIALLAGLGFLLIPNLDRNKGVPNAATQIQGWFNLSKQQALRDKSPRGVRLIHNGDGRCTSLQYIEQPEPVAPRGPGIRIDIRTMPAYDPVLFPVAPNIGPLTVVTLFQDPTNTVPPGVYPPEQFWIDWPNVQEGDYFEATGGPNAVALVRRLTSPPQPNPPGVPPAPTGPAKNAQLVLDRVVNGTEGGQSFQMTTGFRVVRAPRPLTGEPALQVHKDVFIDLTGSYPCPLNIDWPVPGQQLPHPSGLSYGFPNPNPPPNYFTFYAPWGTLPIPAAMRLPQPVPVDVNYIDVLFNSTGAVANAPTGRYVLLVRHVDRPNDRLFVTIYTRTGKIAAHSVYDVSGLDPYLYTQDGNSPGL